MVAARATSQVSRRDIATTKSVHRLSPGIGCVLRWPQIHVAMQQLVPFMAVLVVSWIQFSSFFLRLNFMVLGESSPPDRHDKVGEMI